MKKTNISLNGKCIMVTGAAGFIGSNLVLRLLSDYENIQIIGVDSMSDYYDVSLKEFRLKQMEKKAEEKEVNQWIFQKGNIADRSFIDGLFSEYRPSVVVNLAAQAGVRYSITNPDAYVESNMIGFYNI